MRDSTWSWMPFSSSQRQFPERLPIYPPLQVSEALLVRITDRLRNVIIAPRLLQLISNKEKNLQNNVVYHQSLLDINII